MNPRTTDPVRVDGAGARKLLAVAVAVVGLASILSAITMRDDSSRVSSPNSRVPTTVSSGASDTTASGAIAGTAPTQPIPAGSRSASTAALVGPSALGSPSSVVGPSSTVAPST